MNSLKPDDQAPRRFCFRKRYLLLPLLCMPLFMAVALINVFRLGSDACALRESLMGENTKYWKTKVNVRVGFMPLAAVRMLSHFVALPPEPRAVIGSVRRAEVGVYRFEGNEEKRNSATAMERADRVMTARGWQRMLVVSSNDKLVLMYVPRDGSSAHRLTCCLAVMSEHDLVIASGSGNLEPLVQLAIKEMDKEARKHESALKEPANDKNVVAYLHQGHW